MEKLMSSILLHNHVFANAINDYKHSHMWSNIVYILMECYSATTFSVKNKIKKLMEFDH
jgi:hypothetical protein